MEGLGYNLVGESIKVRKNFYTMGKILAPILLVLVSGAAWAQTPPQEKTPAVAKQQRYAILIGVETYTNISPSFQGPNQDVCSLRKTLISAGKFEAKNILVLTNTYDREDACSDVPKYRPSHAEVRKRVRMFLSKIPNGSLLLFSFSGHGRLYKNESFLMLEDSDEQNKRPMRAVGLSELRATLLSSSSRAKDVILLLDACRDSASGDAKEALKSGDRDLFAGKRSNLGKTLSVFFSTSAGHFSYIRSHNPISYFSWGLIRGLTGDAANSKGLVTLGALGDYLKGELPEMVNFDFVTTGVRKQQQTETLFLPKGKGAEELIISDVSSESSHRFSYFYSVEVLLSPKDANGLSLSPQHLDALAPTQSAFMNQQFPFKTASLTPLGVITVKYDRGNPEDVARWDYYVRVSNHFAQQHRSFVLCPNHPNVPDIPYSPERDHRKPEIVTYVKDGSLFIDMSIMFGHWRRFLSDFDYFSEEPEKYGHARFNQCF